MVPPKGVDDETMRLLQEDRVAALSAIAAGVGHQINNPLTYVLTNVALLQDMLSKTAPSAWTPDLVAEMRERIDEIGEGAQRIARVVRDLGVFARGDGSSTNVVDLRRVCEAALGMASNRLQHVARVRCELQDLPPVPGDEASLGRLVYEMLVNAARAIEEGDADRKEITLRTGVEAGGAFVEVSDTGSGRPPDDEPRALDLAMAHRTIAALGGAVAVHREPDVGSTLRVTLPIRPIARPTRRPSQPRTPTIPRLRVLVVDDEPTVGKSLARMLREEHDVTVVTGGREALERIEREAFDVVMLDVMMPDLTGMDLHEILRERHPALADRVLFLSGGAFTERAHEFVREVGDRCLEKPFSMGRVRAALLDLLKRNAH